MMRRSGNDGLGRHAWLLLQPDARATVTQRQYMMDQYMAMQQMMMNHMMWQQQWMTPPAAQPDK